MTASYHVSNSALGSIERECRRYPDAETGGILVGFRTGHSTDADVSVIITHATGPGPNSQRSAAHFVKDTPYLQSELEMLFQYHQVNYLGVWHKHPSDLPVPSSGDVASAMEELEGRTVGLDELMIPIAVVRSGIVDVYPYVINGGKVTGIDWRLVPHDDLPDGRAVATQWHETEAGQQRLADELAVFNALNLKVQVRQGADGSYRVHAPLVDGSDRTLVFLCHADYPVAHPDVALFDPLTQRFEQVESEVADRWHINRTMAEAYQGRWSRGAST
jgi:integrative and conjugative element protein (TIGR02256 family)